MPWNKDIKTKEINSALRTSFISADIGARRFSADAGDILSGDAPIDPIHLLITEYQAAATAKGYNYLGDYSALYSKYEELILNEKINTNLKIFDLNYAYKTDGTNILAILSPVKFNGNFAELLSNTATPIIEENFIVFSKVGSGASKSMILPLDYNSSSFYTEFEGEIFYNSGIVYFIQPSGGLNGSARLLCNTNNRQYSIIYNQDGTSSGNNTGIGYFKTDGSYIYRTEYLRDGVTCLTRVLRDGNLINTFNRQWDGIINSDFLIISNQTITFKIKRIEIGIP